MIAQHALGHLLQQDRLAGARRAGVAEQDQPEDRHDQVDEDGHGTRAALEYVLARPS